VIDAGDDRYGGGQVAVEVRETIVESKVERCLQAVAGDLEHVVLFGPDGPVAYVLGSLG
jgi:hypothetical protein